jgi:hypothetical protein
MKIQKVGGKSLIEVFDNEPVTVITNTNKSIKLAPQKVQDFSINGKWNVSFPSGWGAPDNVVFDSLMSWTDSKEEGIKYFSGIATYTKEIVLAKKTDNSNIYLDLGNVLEMAEVKVNGVNCGIVWIAPYRVNITKAIRKGKNIVEIKVANMWPNRIIGDMNLPAEKRFTKTNVIKFKKTDALRPSGLLGPVAIKVSEILEIKE